jgi:hypothetical protein
MPLDFITSEGHRCQYQLSGVLTHSDINWVADWYCQNHQDKLPTHVWLHPILYKDFAAIHQNPVVAWDDGQPCLMLITGAGILLVKPVPYSFNKFLMLLGTREDYNNYFIDEIFEETVLKDCERE